MTKSPSTLVTYGSIPEETSYLANTGTYKTKGFVRAPPTPHNLNTFITPSSHLFQTVHIGIPNLDLEKYTISISGLVENPLSITLGQLKQFPSREVTSFHECYGPPIGEPRKNWWRVGNVVWKGVELKSLLELAVVKEGGEDERFVWFEGLDDGEFGGERGRYRKDVPLWKVLKGDVLLVYGMNKEELERERGGPVRSVCFGWFGTNSVKWLTRIEVQDRRAPGPFTTKFYNEVIPTLEGGNNKATRPVWGVQPNSMIVSPGEGEVFEAGRSELKIWGWAWSEDSIESVEISFDGGSSWISARVEERVDFSWQRFEAKFTLKSGKLKLMSRAKSRSGRVQPIRDRRNHVHTIEIEVL